MARATISLLIVLAALTSPAFAADDPEMPKVTEVRIGFGGRYKLGAWTPLELRLAGGTRQAIGSVSVEIPDGDDTPALFSTVPGRPIQVLPGATTRVVLYVKPGRQIESLDVVFRRDDGRRMMQTLASLQPGTNTPNSDWPEALAVDDKLCLVLGSWMSIPTDPNQPGWRQVVVDDPAQLPTRWYGYDAVDTLVITTSRPELFKSLSADSLQMAAIEQWVEQGGRLLFSVGAEARTVLGEQAPLGRLAPGALADVRTIHRAEALEKFIAANHRILFQGRAADAGMRVAEIDKPRGVVLAEEGDLPLVVRTPRGFGEITFVAVDLDLRPLADWKSRAEFVDRLLLAGEIRETRPQNNTYVNLGFTDLSGQLRGALDQFTGVRLVPFWIVGLLVFVYILLIGPFDFWLVKKVFKRMELTWITFPTIVAAVCVGAYFAAYWTKGTQLRVNQIDVVDVEPAAGRLRGTSWVNVFSPRTSTYDLTLAPPLPSPAPAGESPLLFSWLGLPGKAWGGMQAAQSGPRLFSEPYFVAPHLNALASVPIDVWSTKSFVGRWQGEPSERIESDLSGALGEAPEGTITSQLSVPLSDCLLASGHWVYELGQLAPGQSVKISAAEKRELETTLRGYRDEQNPKNASYTRKAVPYDPQNLDVPQIIRAMMFHQAGRRWTGLSNHYQHYLDLSDHLQLHQAVLIGRAPDDHLPAPLMRDGQPLPADRHWVFYRFLLPVK